MPGTNDLNMNEMLLRRRNEINHVLEIITSVIPEGTNLETLTVQDIQAALKGRFNSIAEDIEALSQALQALQSGGVAPHASTHTTDGQDKIQNASPTADGLMSAADKSALTSLINHNHAGVYEPANSNIQTHISATGNPHGTTAADIGAAEEFHNHSGIYEPVNSNIQTHIGTTGNPHGTTLAQLGAFDANGNALTGLADGANPTDATTLQQVEQLVAAASETVPASETEAGVVMLATNGEATSGKAVQGSDSRLAHASATGNPHGTTASDVGAEPANSNIQTHIGTIGNPHGTTAADIGAEPVSTSGKLILCPEFTNSVLSGLAFTDKLGIMVTNHDLANNVNYYKWTSPETTVQSYGIVVMMQVPSMFDAFDAASFKLQTEGVASVDVSVTDTTGLELCSFNQTGSIGWVDVPLSAPQLAALNGGNWAGDMFKVIFSVHAANNESCFVGPLSMTYSKSA